MDWELREAWELLNSIEKQMQENIAKNNEVLQKTNWVKVNKTRRNRGYTFEDKIRKKVNEIDNQRLWHCRRLGGSSTGLPDLVITFNQYMGALVAMECKSTKDNYVLEIPADQVQRCIDVLDVFGMYGCKSVGFGFYFAKSEKCKRDKPIQAYWLMSRFDPNLMLELMTNLTKVTFDSRTKALSFRYADTTSNTLGPSRFHGYQQDFETLIGTIESEAAEFQQVSHNENQTEQGRKPDNEAS